MNSWQTHQRERKRREQLMNDLNYYQSLRDMNRSEKSLDQLCDRYSVRALEAHNAGNHALAVQLAGEAARLKKLKDLGDGMKNAVEAAHSVQSAQRAMAGMLDSTRAVAASQLRAAALVSDTHADLAMLQHQVQSLTDQCDMLCNEMVFEDEPSDDNADGQRYLQELIESSRKQHTRVLNSTRQCLDKLPHTRQLENERK